MPVSAKTVASLHIPREGENGLFTQSWFPICQSADVPPASIRGFDFLDGRVIVVRSAGGKVRVQSALCPHVGADLACGDLVGDEVRCAFHHWRYDAQGKCAATGIGDPAPRTARLFNFPTIERWGLIFAYNGETPHYHLPSFEYPDDQLAIRTGAVPLVNADPWIVCANTPDWQHIRTLHGVQIDSEDPDKIVQWNDHSFLYTFSGRFWHGEPVTYSVGIYGTSLFFQQGKFNGKWMGVMAPMGLPRPGQTRAYFVIAALPEDGAEEAHLEATMNMERSIVAQDMHVLNRIIYRHGTLTKADRLLSHFFEFVRNYPRAHPAANYIK